jgi:hypothetical protein
VTQTAPTMLTAAETSVESLERLQRRVELQERWRRNVEQITELAIAFHSSQSSCGPDDPDEKTADHRDVAYHLDRARASLSEVEDAMRALDAEPVVIGGYS